MKNNSIDPDVICFQEMPRKTELKGYNLVMHESNSYRRSGIGIYVRETIGSQALKTKYISITDNVLLGGVKLFGKRGNIDIINAYISPKAKIKNLNGLHDFIPQLSKKAIIVGDFNAHHLIWDPTWPEKCEKS